ncbi:hypothetical protein KR018_007282, partial [Drosophila ironensis]
RLRPRWWSGGLAGAFCQTITCPFDLLETRMVSEKKKRTMFSTARFAVKNHGNAQSFSVEAYYLSLCIRCTGFISLYDGLSAKLTRQLTYTTLRFHLYQLGKQEIGENSFFDQILVASLAGSVASIVGIPTELINSRMHVDRVLPADQQRKYRHVFHGLYRVWKDEGWMTLYRGGFFSIFRSSVVTICQNVAYDRAFYMESFQLDHDRKLLHVLSSVSAAFIYAPIIQPIENVRTLQMTKTGKVHDHVKFLLRLGPRGLFRGLGPCLMRMAPNTVIIFLMFEQLRLHFGYYEEIDK